MKPFLTTASPLQNRQTLNQTIVKCWIAKKIGQYECFLELAKIRHMNDATVAEETEKFKRILNAND